MNQYPEYQMLIKALQREQDPTVIAQLRQRIGKYERMISDTRQQLRLSNAQLEASLFRWGYVSTLLNSSSVNFL